MRRIAVSRNYANTIDMKNSVGYTLVLAAIYCILRSCTRKIVEKSIRTNTFKIAPQKQRDTIFKQKFKSSTWKLFIYTFLMVYGISYIPRLNWIFIPVTYMFPYKCMPIKVLAHYFFEFVHYLLSTFFLFSEPRKKDFLQMLAHHILTLLLIFFSFRQNFPRYGIVIMLLHDISDPFLEFAKLCNYLGFEKTAKVSFLFFTIIFLVSRIIVFPLGIVLPLFFSSRFFKVNISSYLFPFGLVILFLINAIWMLYIFKMLFRIALERKVEDDVRSIDQDSHN